MDQGSKSGPVRVLCLDGGDARCMSELHMLQEFMQRVELETGRKKIRPCDYFDLVVAVDAAGFIAALLVLFGMSIDEAQEEFYRVYNAVFANEESTPEQRSLKMADAIKELLGNEKFHIPETAKLSDVTFGGDCKLALCYTSTVQMGHCRMFKNYTSLPMSQEATIFEAMLATWTTPGLLSPVLIGPKGREEEVVSAVNGFCNPTQECIAEAYKIFGAERNISCLLSLGSGRRGPISLEMTASNSGLEPTGRRAGNSGQPLGWQVIVDCESIDEQLQRRIRRLGVYYRFSVDSGLEGHKLFKGGFGIIASHSTAYFSTEVISSQMDDCLKAAEKSGGVTLERIYRSRNQGNGSSHGLPPLSAFFIPRKNPMEALVKSVIDTSEFTQRITVLSGMAGSGKTQLALKFARDYEESFQHILFIDASSEESIERNMIARVRAVSGRWHLNSLEEALDTLAEADEVVTKDWLVILDNADDATIDLPKFFPTCNFGSILITTRNPTIGSLSPNSHITLDVMIPEEAVNALIASIFHSTSSTSTIAKNEPSTGNTAPTQRDREAALAIVERLGCLPIAVIQAGCYIKQHQCLHEYLQRLESNRPELLKRATRVHLDRLKYPHSVYAAFDVTLEVLSPRARQILGILSFVHYTNFPRPLFSMAAKVDFALDPYDLLDRGPEFTATTQFLRDVLCPDGVWRDDNLDDLFEELQSYSLISLVPIYSLVTLRFHPLAHAWSRDRMSIKEQDIHRAAAVRLLVCGISTDSEPFWDFISPHVNAVSSILDTLHVNDRAAFAAIIRNDGKYELLLKLWQQIYAEVEAIHGRMHIRTSRAALELADAVGQDGDWNKMAELEREVVATRELILGRDHPETAKARENLSRTLRGLHQYDEALELQKEVLHSRLKTIGLCNADTADGMIEVAHTLRPLSQLSDEQAFLQAAVEIQTKVHGRSSVQIVQTLELLAQCYSRQEKHEEAEKVQKEVLLQRQLRWGAQHLTTVKAMAWLAQRYHEQNRHKEAEGIRVEEVAIRRQFQGESHTDTLDALYWWGRSCYEMSRYLDAISIWKEELEHRRVVHGEIHVETLGAERWIARAAYSQGLYAEAEFYAKQAVEGYEKMEGNDYGSEGDLEWDNEVSSAIWGTAGRTDGIDSAYWAGRSCFAQEHWEDAEKWLKKAALGYRKYRGHSHEHTNLSTFWFARSIYEQNRWEEARKWFIRALEGYRKSQGLLDGNTLNSIYWVGQTYFQQKQYEETIKWWLEELEGRQAFKGNLDTGTLGTMSWVGRAMFENNSSLDVADDWSTKATLGYQQTMGQHHIDAINSSYWLSRVKFSRGMYEEAEKWFTKATEGYRIVRGEHHAHTYQGMYWLGRTRYQRSHYDEALDAFKQTMDGQLKLYGENHADTLNSMYWYGHCFYSKEAYADAETWWKRELEGRKVLHGRVHLETISTFLWLGRAAFHQEQYQRAEEWLIQAIDGYKQLGSEQSTDALDSLFWRGKCTFAQKRWDETAIYWKEELEGRLKVHTELHLETLGTIQWLSRIGLETKQYEDGHMWSKRALDGYQKLQSENSTEILNTKYWWAHIYYGQGSYAEAVRLWNEALAGYKEGKRRSDILATLFWLGKAAFAQIQYDEAERLWKEELDERRVDSSKPDKLIGRVLSHLARLYHQQDRREEAQKAAQEALSIQQEVLKSDDPDLLETIELVKLIEPEESQPTVIHPQIPIEVEPAVSGAADSDWETIEEDAAPDPGGGPSASSELLSQASSSFPPPRPRSPFHMRSQFGSRPNSWSMF